MCTSLAMSNVANNDSAHSKQLFEAVKMNDTSGLMDLVLSTHCDPRCVRNDQQQTLLHFACQLNHSNVIDMVRTLVEIYHCNPLLRDQHSLTAYHYACMSGNLLVLSYLSRSGNFHYNTRFIPPTLSFVTNSGQLKSQMLRTTSRSGNIAMTRFTFMLLNHTDGILKLKLNLFNDALHILCKNINCWLLQGMHYFHDSSEDSIALYEACCAGNLQAVKFYLEELRVIVSHQLLPTRFEREKVHASLLEAAYRLNNVQIAQYLTITRGFSPIQNITRHDTYIDFCPQYEFELQNYIMPGTSPLHMAIRSGNVQAVLESISHDSPQVSSPIISDHLTLLHSACISGKLDMVKIVTDKLKCDINACNSNGDTPLHVACEWGHLEVCLLLLEQYGCKINVGNAHGHTPLMLAIRHNRFEIFQTLLEKGADISSITTDAKETTLHLACCHDSSKFASALLGYATCAVLLNASDEYGDTPLFNACRVGNIKVVRNLVVNLDCERLYVNPVTNETPAHIACRINRLDILRVLTSEGIDVPLKCNQVNHLKKSLLHIACENDSEDIVDYLIESKVCKENNEDCNGHTPLHIAIIRGNFSIVKKLLMSQTCKITDKDKNENTVLHYVCTRQVVDSNLVKTLSDYSGPGASLIEKQNKDGYIPLHYICENDGVQVLRCLLAHFSLEEVNAALGCPNKLNNTPVHLAFKKRKTAIIKYLWKCTELADGVSKAMLMQNSDGNNIFHLAMEYSRSYGDIIYNADGTQSSKTFAVTIIETVLQCMSSEDDVVLCLCQKNCKGYTPIEYLIDKSHPKSDCHHESSVLSCLFYSSKLSQSSKQNIFAVTSSCGDTLIHLATARYKFEVVKLLVEKGVRNPQISNDKGETSLHLACTNGCSEISMFLCEYGCSLHQLDKSGYSPLFKAFQTDETFLLQLISKGHWTPECPVIELTSDNKYYGRYYEQTMLRQDSADPPTTFTLPLIHCVLFLSTQERILKQMADIVVKHKIPDLCDSLGNTILHLYSMLTFQNFVYLKEVLALSKCDVNQLNLAHNTPLHIASYKNNTFMVMFLIENDKCRSVDIENEEKHTPVFYAKDREIINSLILNGADPNIVAESARFKVILEKSKHEHPLNLTVTALILGNSLAGKTTLLKSLTKAYNWDRLSQPSIGQVEQKCERTAGIEISEYEVVKERSLRVLFYDFAGHPEFHSTHTVLLQNRLSFSESSQDSPLLFVIVLDITAPDKLKQLKYWTNFIQNCQLSCNTGRKPEVIIIGSHVDMYSDSHDMQRHTLSQAMDNMSDSVELVENPILLNCCKPKEKELQKVKALLKRSAQKLEKHADLDNRCHLIFSYLYANFPDKPVKFSELHGKLRMRQETGNIDFPFTRSKLIELLTSMHSMQHILLIGLTSESRDFWILTAKAQNSMFYKIHGLLFAGEDFDMRPRIESNVGVISSAEIKELFPEIEYEMLQEFLVYSEFCKKIDDEEVLKLIEGGTSASTKGEQKMSLSTQHDQDMNDDMPEKDSITPTSLSDPSVASDQCSSVEYFFFPGLVKEREKRNLNWKGDDKYSYCSGWSLESVQGDFFSPLFLQVLLLRLIFQFATTSKPENLLHRRCIIWKNGVFWSAPGVEMLVEVTSQNQSVLVLVRCFQETELEAIKLRSAVVKEVLKVKAKHSSVTIANEYVIYNPSLDESGSLAKPVKMVAIEEIASAISKGTKYVQDNLFQHCIINKDLLCFEPYAGIDDTVMTSLFDPDKANESVPECILSTLYSKANALPRHIDQFTKLISELKKPVLYQYLRDLFDEYSVFHGRDPKGLKCTKANAQLLQ